MLFHNEGCGLVSALSILYQAFKVYNPRSQQEGQVAAGLQNTGHGGCHQAFASAQPHIPAVERKLPQKPCKGEQRLA